MRKQWVVGVSGGADSMALLDMLRKEDKVAVVAHVNYHKRETSDYDMDLVADYANAYNLPFVCAHYNQETQENFQTSARIYRYDLFVNLVDAYHAEGIAVAHHFDDDVETYIFQKERNMKSDVVGLGDVIEYRGHKVWRPLLHLRKEALIQYCKNNAITFVHDESNDSLDYTRNRIRHDLMKMSESEFHKLVVTMQDEKMKWASHQARLTEIVTTWTDTVATKEFQTFDHKEDILRLWLKREGVDVSTLTERYLKEIVDVLLKGKGQFTFNDFMIEGTYGKITLTKLKSVHDVYEELEYVVTDSYQLTDHGLGIEGINLTAEDFPITIRNAKSTDVIELRFGHKKLNRFFVDRKIPHGLRKNWLVVENSLKHVVFVVGIGCDVHHYANNPNLFMIKL